MKEKPKETKVEQKKVAKAVCKDRDCSVHGNLNVRGRVFEGRVIRKFPRRITIEFERMVYIRKYERYAKSKYIRKYERYAKSKTKIHARLPECMEGKIDVGDLVRVQECRPLSKIIHFIVINKVGGKEK
jgi:small subunit ribosomal protein S17